MADEITIGKHHYSKWVVIGVAAGGAIACYVVWQRHQADVAAGSTSTTSDMVTDPETGVAYPADATDPVTGETYAQEIGQYGSVEAADESVQETEDSYLYSQGDLYGTGYPTSEYSTGTYGADTTTTGSVYTSDSAWAQAATAGLTDIGYDGTEVAQALGDYLTGTPVTSEEATIIKAAISEYGSPPVGSFQIVLQPTTTTTTTMVTVPNVIGMSNTAATTAIENAGLVPGSEYKVTGTVDSQTPKGGTSVPKGSTVDLGVAAATTATTVKPPATPTGVHATPYSTFIDVAWTPVPGATGYTLHATYQEPTSGAGGVYPGTVTSAGHGRISGLAPNRTYTLHVAAKNSAGTSPETNGPAVKTTK